MDYDDVSRGIPGATAAWTGGGTAAAGPATLDLPPPQDLPAELSLTEAEADSLRDALAALLRALEDSDPQQRIVLIRILMQDIGPSRGTAIEPKATSIPASRDEVADFDRYFGVRRIQGDAPARALFRGLLQTAAGVLELAERSMDLPPAQIERQIAGFAAYARLLGRVCGLGALR